MMRIDCQSHIFPQAYADLLTHGGGVLKVRKTGRQYAVDYGGVYQAELDLERYNPALKLEEMDRAGIDLAILSVNMPGPEWLEPESALQGAQLCNDYIAELCARYPRRFAGLACLPLPDVPAALAEMDRAAACGLRGIILYSHIRGKPVDSPEFEPVFARAEQLGLPVVLHPTAPLWGSVLAEYDMIPMVGFMMDTSIAMLRLILSGLLERYPNLIVVHPHAGGALPYLIGRVVEQTEVKKRGRTHIRHSPEYYYRKVYLDLVSPSALAIRYAYDFSGADRLLFGSDHPWVAPGGFLEIIERMPIPESEREKILALNAIRLFRL
jgi:aminocarboxymuconate-semialdehyde decarboxylase